MGKQAMLPWQVDWIEGSGVKMYPMYHTLLYHKWWEFDCNMMEKDGKRPNLIEKGLKMMEIDGK